MTRIALPESWRGRAIIIGDAIFSDGWFTDEELAESATFTNEKRRTEWKHARLAIKQLAIELGLCMHAHDCTMQRPRLLIRGEDVNRFVSISHSGGYAAAAIDTSPIGVDIERLRHLPERGAHLFLTDAETAQMRDCAVPDRMIHWWSAKEAVWKQRHGDTETLKRTAVKFEAETATGLRFAEVETFAIGELVAALTLPTSAAGSSRR